MRELTLNVIYTPGTVGHLSLLIWSMLDHSNCRFRLVANGCSPDEMALLRRLCEQSPRLAFLALPTRSMMPHGQALNHLQADTEGDRFAFLDSDICAVGPLPARILELSPGHKVCCCYPATVSRYPKRSERPTQSNLEEETCTYLAVYDNDAVRKLRQSTGIGFGKYEWPEIPRQQQERLIRMGLKRPHYKTAQLLSFLILQPDERPVVLRSQALMHIGGFSGWMSRDRHGPGSRLAAAVGRLAGPRLKELIDRLLRWNAKELRRRRRQDVSHYFGRFFEALFAGESLPEPPKTGDATIDHQVQVATQVITTVFEKHGSHHVTTYSRAHHGRVGPGLPQTGA